MCLVSEIYGKLDAPCHLSSCSLNSFFGSNFRTLLWLSVVSLPLMGVMWVLAVLAASENSQLLTILLSAVVLVHAFFCIIGYCIINKRVRENLRRTVLRCMGRKVPLLDSSLVISSSSQNVASQPRTPGGFLAGNYETARRNIGISASSTTSRSTAKTSSSPYRSDGQLRHTSTSTSNYNSDVPSYMRGFDGNTRHREEKHRRHRKDSDSGSETDGRSLDLASSHSSDEDESRVGRNSTNTHRSTGVSAAPSYLPNITEHVQATTPPELNVVQSPQLFPSIKPVYAPRWSSQLPEAFLPNPNGKTDVVSFVVRFITKKISFQLVVGLKTPVPTMKSIRIRPIHRTHYPILISLTHPTCNITTK